MRVTVKTGIISALVWIVLKYSFFTFGFFEDTLTPAILLNILGLLVAISVGLFLQKMKDTEETSALYDIKNGMAAGLPYVLLVSIFIYLYYAKINPEYYQNKIAEKEVAVEKMVNDPKALEEFKKTMEDAEVMTKAEIEAKLKENIRKGGTPGFTTTLSLLALMILATVYSILVTVIYRKIMFTRIKSGPELDAK